MTAYLLLTKGEASLARRGPFPVITRAADNPLVSQVARGLIVEKSVQTGRVVEKARVGNLAALVNCTKLAERIEEALKLLAAVAQSQSSQSFP
jgi:hypothetical protein